MGLQAQLLLAKIYYCKGEYNKALKILNDTPLDKTDIESSSSRMMHVVAESYAVKGNIGDIFMLSFLKFN